MITRIEIDGFKSFLGFSLDLTPFTVLAGPNGTGKSNLFEAIDLARRLITDTDGRSWLRGMRRGQLIDQFHTGPDGVTVPQMRLLVRFLVDLPGHGLQHVEAVIEAELREAPGMPETTVRLRALAELPEGWTLTDQEAAAVGRPVLQAGAFAVVMAASHGGWLEMFHRELFGWTMLAPDPESIRMPSDLYDSDALSPSGRNLPGVLGRLLGESGTVGTPESFRLLADAAAVLRGLTGVVPTPDPNRGVWDLDLVYEAAAKVPVRLASDGTLRILALLTAAHDPDNPGTLMVEEPENGLHPGQVRELVRRLRATTNPATRRQILLTTHSPVVLSALLPDHQGDAVFIDTVTRVGGDRGPVRHTRARRLGMSGEPGTFVPAREARRFLESAVAGPG
ncbi:putative ATPase [Kitasatospora sp. MAP12-15]|uniref:AAA family ATPase n=1 Tax=unclassified Kitasatospora TaxID=2633591 RepID=UPI0024747674|nr:ATP-binding protein [Kitasatospora sp. MAP12-44]MDH6112942.1 putative ATPase [Kitasatospora sp. MAP12-44]